MNAKEIVQKDKKREESVQHHNKRTQKEELHSQMKTEIKIDTEVCA